MHDLTRLGPLTASVFGADGDPQHEASRLLHEWLRYLAPRGGHVLAWVGAEVTGPSAERDHFSWCWLDAPDPDRQPPGPAEEAELASRSEHLLTPLAHAGRMQLLLSLRAMDAASAEALAERCGRTLGEVQTALRVLADAGYVVQTADPAYRITPLGRQLALTLSRMAAWMIEDAGESGMRVQAQMGDER